MWRYFQNKKDEFVRKILRPVPEDFFSFETGEPFEVCIECKSDITGPNSDYIIEKAWQDDELIYEYALCESCCRDLRGEMSKESMKYLKKALRKPVLKTTIDGCRCCGLPRLELPGYTLIGSCLGREMIFWNVPVLICEPCLAIIAEGLSKQTRDIMDDFEERNFPGPPEAEIDLPKPRRKVVLM
ncbi:MAG: hypothetical protein P1V20_00425 [Verrucomicrobiales bacterium]|nr:hypothetical protein [Verrucomicrobiales bacterium]